MLVLNFTADEDCVIQLKDPDKESKWKSNLTNQLKCFTYIYSAFPSFMCILSFPYFVLLCVYIVPRLVKINSMLFLMLSCLLRRRKEKTTPPTTFKCSRQSGYLCRS